MLKIKDDVDLNIFIEKYNFKPEYDENTGKLIALYRINGYYKGETIKKRKTTTITRKENKKRHLDMTNKKAKMYWAINVLTRHFFKMAYNDSFELELDSEDYEILYDLIQDGLVEKVEDK